MNRPATWMAVACALGAVMASCALSREGAFEPVIGGPCASAADCPGDDDPECGTRACVDGACQGYFAAPGSSCAGGVCDGVGRCVGCLTRADCEQPICVDGILHAGEECDQGVCIALLGNLECAPYACHPAMAHCYDGCDDELQCAPGHYCDSDGACAPKLPPGQPCRAASECASGFCADGVCCDAACEGACESCGVDPGACTPYPAGTDPEGECGVASLGCSGAPVCASCGTIPQPPGTGPCPPRCSSCSQGVCTITCQNDSCQTSGVLECPEGWHCTVDCVDDRSCEDLVIQCPEAYQCDVHCGDAGHRCEDATIECSTAGGCNVECIGGDACNGATVSCGDNVCNVQCIGNGKPTVNGCDNACGSCMLAGC